MSESGSQVWLQGHNDLQTRSPDNHLLLLIVADARGDSDDQTHPYQTTGFGWMPIHSMGRMELVYACKTTVVKVFTVSHVHAYNICRDSNVTCQNTKDQGPCTVLSTLRISRCVCAEQSFSRTLTVSFSP